MTVPVDITFVPGTTITSEWLNGVNDFVQNTISATLTVEERYIATAGQTVFPIANPDYIVTTPVTVYINGILQDPVDAYVVSGLTVVLSEGAQLDDEVVLVLSSGASLNHVAASSVTYSQDIPNAVNRDVQSKLQDTVSVKDFGAVGDGVADDTLALQAALDSNTVCYVPPGKYRIVSTLIVDPSRNRGNGFTSCGSNSRYPTTQQPGGPVWDGKQEAIIFFDGSASSSSAVISASAEAIGVEPVATFADTIWSFTLDNVTLDANNKAGYGLYAARVQDMQFQHVRATGATVAGYSINGTYSGSIESCRAFLNPGRGFELGAADIRWGWTAQDKINALYIRDLHCDANGSDSTFRESDPILKTNNCGVYFGPHRGCLVTGVVSENNFGANVVYAPSGAGNAIQGIYTELGCQYAPNGSGTDAISLGYATKPWGIIYVGVSGALHNRVSDGVIATDAIWLTGTEPSAAREEGGFEIHNIGLGSGALTADWANYRLVNCVLELDTITGTQPSGDFTINGGLRVTGQVRATLLGNATGTYTITGAAISASTLVNCTISYIATGIVDVALTNAMSDINYTVICLPSQAARAVAITSKDVDSFRILYSVTTTGDLVDPTAPITFLVIGNEA